MTTMQLARLAGAALRAGLVLAATVIVLLAAGLGHVEALP